MKRNILALMLVVGLICGWGALGTAADLGYRIKTSDSDFIQPAPEVNSSVAFADAVIARPVGLVTTIAGIGIFLVTLPMTAPSGDAGGAAWNLIGKPGGWTFDRSLGRSAPQYQDKGVFGR
jgi:hypothetical protein